MSRGKKITVWVLQVVMGLMFLAAGYSKFGSSEVWQQKFGAWGFPDNVYLIIGAVEMVGAVLLLIPQTARYSAAFLLVIMLGATGTHLLNNEIGELLRPLLFMIPLSAIWMIRKES